jgi:endonuclease/exonuclease/phosphatase family metal-dependent hydrolase
MLVSQIIHIFIHHYTNPSPKTIFIMKNIIWFFAMLSLLLTFCTSQHKQHEFTVMTLNIRFDNPNDAPNDWPNRIAVVEQYMNDVMPDLVGVQESLHHQNEHLLRIMPGYTYVGTGRDDGKQGGEYSPIFIRTDSFELLDHSQFWLSETPDVPGSIGWEAVLPRVVAWAKLRHHASGKELFVFNTHYSHVSDLARRRSMEFMAQQIRKIADDMPVIVTGDFNITKGSELYNDMVVHFKENNNLQNAELIAQQPVINAASTFNAFRHDTQPRVIDYIFVNNHFQVKSYQVDEVVENDIFISDHWPVWAKVQFSKP